MVIAAVGDQARGAQSRASGATADRLGAIDERQQLGDTVATGTSTLAVMSPRVEFAAATT